jgi:hypothetical protein
MVFHISVEVRDRFQGIPHVIYQVCVCDKEVLLFNDAVNCQYQIGSVLDE